MTDPGQEKQTLKFYFTARQALAGELDQKNPHAKDSTFQPEVVEALGERFGDTITGVTEYASEHTVFVERSARRMAEQFVPSLKLRKRARSNAITQYVIRNTE